MCDHCNLHKKQYCTNFIPVPSGTTTIGKHAQLILYYSQDKKLNNSLFLPAF